MTREKFSELTESTPRPVLVTANTRNVEMVVQQYAKNASCQVPSLESPLWR